MVPLVTCLTYIPTPARYSNCGNLVSSPTSFKTSDISALAKSDPSKYSSTHPSHEPSHLWAPHGSLCGHGNPDSIPHPNGPIRTTQFQTHPQTPNHHPKHPTANHPPTPPISAANQTPPSPHTRQGIRWISGVMRGVPFVGLPRQSSCPGGWVAGGYG